MTKSTIIFILAIFFYVFGFGQTKIEKHYDLIIHDSIKKKITKTNKTAQPLFVVDGVPFINEKGFGNFTQGKNEANSKFLDIEPNSIAAITILKDKKAVTAYGNDARAGAVLVTTKNPDLEKIRKYQKTIFEQSQDNSKKKFLIFLGK